MLIERKESIWQRLRTITPDATQASSPKRQSHNPQHPKRKTCAEYRSYRERYEASAVTEPHGNDTLAPDTSGSTELQRT
ncbi:hypothetical protein GCM10027595_06260 [Corynebacterium nasicanis]